MKKINCKFNKETCFLEIYYNKKKIFIISLESIKEADESRFCYQLKK